MRKLLISVCALAILASLGCHISDYPVITDDRGDFSGVIRTGHRAYIMPTGQVATIWDDGSDELLTLVFQNQYGDQKLYTKNNFDPTASVLWVDQTYCDWRFLDCEIATSWNPAQGPDDIFDYDAFPDCPGYRSLSLLVSQGSRVGECGDGLFWNGDKQALFGEFAQLPTTTWRGGTAYVVNVNAGNTTVDLTAGNTTATVPIYGNFTAFITDDLNMAAPMTPNVRNELMWLRSFIGENGDTLNATINYGSLTGSIDLRIVAGGLNAAIDRF
ncbi:MAG: hypothetical protein D6718_06350 [Acidobacteria bacterium]|nr:MAG: hypothetical protein D6718_06350 [Acidobacteriota bacterium]